MAMTGSDMGTFFLMVSASFRRALAASASVVRTGSPLSRTCFSSAHSASRAGSASCHARTLRLQASSRGGAELRERILMRALIQEKPEEKTRKKYADRNQYAERGPGSFSLKLFVLLFHRRLLSGAEEIIISIQHLQARDAEHPMPGMQSIPGCGRSERLRLLSAPDPAGKPGLQASLRPCVPTWSCGADY